MRRSVQARPRQPSYLRGSSRGGPSTRARSWRENRHNRRYRSEQNSREGLPARRVTGSAQNGRGSCAQRTNVVVGEPPGNGHRLVARCSFEDERCRQGGSKGPAAEDHLLSIPLSRQQLVPAGLQRGEDNGPPLRDKFSEPFNGTRVNTAGGPQACSGATTRATTWRCTRQPPSRSTTVGSSSRRQGGTAPQPIRALRSGVVSAHGKGQYSYRYGYIETRVKIPRGMGLWPAVWLLPKDPAAAAEMDVIEARGQEPRKNHMTLHYSHSQVKRVYTGHDMSRLFPHVRSDVDARLRSVVLGR